MGSEADSPILGHIDARLEALCQRCLEPMDIHVTREVCVAMVGEDTELASLDAAYDPLVVGDQPISLSGLLEDELILAMPDFSRHPSGACDMPPGADILGDAAPSSPQSEDGHRDTAGRSGEDNPFLVLESIKSRKRPS